MDYAQTYHIGNNQATRTNKTKAVVPTAQRVCPLDAKTQRCGRGSKRQTQGSTCGNVANGFLKTSFLPRLKETETVQACMETAKIQKDFYKSLSLLAEHYKIEPMQTNQFDYPYNMALALWDIEEKLKQSVLNWQEIRLVQDSKKTYFISEEKYSTGTTLYYIPIEPLYQILHDPKRKRNAQLLISVCSYLYHIADIPYFRQEDSYLYWMYEMHKEWVEQDDETEENEAYKLEFEKAEFIGNSIEQKIFNPMSLQVFGQRLDTFKRSDAFDHECWLTATNAFALFTEYPKASIFRNAPMPEQDLDDEECDNGTIGMEKYISFISHTKGWLYENLAESINNEFNEYAAMQEPTICKRFDKKKVAENTLDFENGLFALLDDMCSLLYNFKTTRR
ncbi:hypothetical protein [Flavobacterium pectinovorum]|uniref:PRTRC system protein F n=1 Tax=Flavobacterium pectinovorum TaxID=29533 RepID=A0AB36P5S6_9FLAO|nr:hypothetical protein [Flavobacterium pectinovorum]OXB07765.1 hypothetical protein B0A72_02555 [Flavobacterium pectinovorum]SHM79786.1 hypothetical protein SAMN05444387_3217 [Flavobacterium pectinovorum]